MKEIISHLLIDFIFTNYLLSPSCRVKT